MELSPIQKDILITLITLYHESSSAIKGEGIAEVLKRNPGTVRNQMQALRALGLVDGVPGPKGGYTPTSQAYRELNIDDYANESLVPIRKDEELVPSVNVSEIDFTTLCHPDICQAVVKLIGSAKNFDIGDSITIGPSPVTKLLVRGEIYGKDEVSQSLLITITEMISLPKKRIKHYMSSPVISIDTGSTFADAFRIFSEAKIHGAPVTANGKVIGIVTLTDIAGGIARGKSLTDSITDVMTRNVVTASPNINLYEVIGRFKEENIGRLVIIRDNKPVGILTQSDIIHVFPSL
ncbi:CBS domain-containing protein [Methanogenium organophilum]|uniref:CBS domain-containing protein n=1 Tax=Methanogenium organophilum TaxID=2199 RepID=A0A9X9T8D1_METOG|nr:CBS domain-containing protein [Methanogenium organophilum]WAI01316.1 CBS domain-containing protein [Methanogenium organophilum]